ncbi:MAG: alginate export family protein [Pseudobdellovibrionaceae bacterium]|nr:alginate export family protein [Bdellovibrionales bacterium]USN46134.1 MAG: alginate export family protein [Pseudobdellovibrionaceae bacterium]
MKKIIAFLALCAFMPNAFADSAELSHDAEFRLRYKNDMDKDGDATVKDTAQSFEQRLKWGMTFRAGEKLTARATLVHNAMWGLNYQDQTPSDVTATGENLILVNEAYASWMASDEFMLRAGRGSFTLADGKVIDANDYYNVAKAFDGFMGTYDAEFARFSFFGVKADDTGNTPGDNEINFYGLSFDFKSLPEVIKMANLHVLQVNADDQAFAGAVSPKQSQMRYGLTVAGDMAGVMYGLTYAGVTGTVDSTPETSISSSMMDLYVGYAMPDMMNLMVKAGYHMDSGDDDATDDTVKTYDGFHYDKHYNAGLMDVMKWGNLTYMYLNAGLDVAEGMNLGLGYYMFSLSEAKGAYTAMNTAFSVGADSTRDKSGLGSELDLTLTKKYDDNFEIATRYAMFTPGELFEGANEDAYSQLWIQGKMNF